MKVLVDTSVWSLALRRKADLENPYVLELEELVKEFKVRMIGPIRQEILLGVRSKEQFRKLQQHLRAFPDMKLTEGDYERAAEIFNLNRSKGIQGSNTDFLLCSLSERHDMPIFTTDADFSLFQKHTDISLHKPRFL